MAKYRQDNYQQHSVRVNERIRFSPLLVIDQHGQKLGVLSNEEAKERARQAGLDLVEVAADARPPVVKIMDFGKFKYEQTLKDKKQRHCSKNQTKEIRLSPKIAEHDVLTKINSAKKHLEGGHKVQFRLEYKKRENAHRELGFEVMDKIIKGLNGIGKVVNAPRLDGRLLVCLMEPDK